jgi:hypothetical protein
MSCTYMESTLVRHGEEKRRTETALFTPPPPNSLKLSLGCTKGKGERRVEWSGVFFLRR